MRGTLFNAPPPRRYRRFIPAHAGNTFKASDPVYLTAVHPRASGEHRFKQRGVFLDFGSSPRMRGTPIFFLISSGFLRFIPAHAGNTSKLNPYHISRSVHPRACGEHSQLLMVVKNSCGSSPRMRGTHSHTAFLVWDLRFIPAHAGNTIPTFGIRKKPTVHPRACGEHSVMRLASVSMSGSSPRMRGTQRPQLTAY